MTHGMHDAAPAVIGTAGHVDHGKSTLVRALTGTDPDRWAEERRRGLTIDLGFAHATLPSGAVLSLVDVPGHVRFIANMLAGAGSIDGVLFVVDAGEGWKPQSEEHLRILELLGLRHGVVVLTKCDLVDDEWRELQAMDVADHLAGTFLEDAPIVGVSAARGQGMGELTAAIEAMLAAIGPSPDRRRPRLWVDRAFAIAGAGTVVTGSLVGGELALDQHVDVVPGGSSVRIRGLQVHGQAVDRARPGQRVAVNLSGVDLDAIRRGDALVHAEQWRPSTRLDASLTVLASLSHVVSRRGAYQAFIGSGNEPVRVRVLGQASIAPGDSGLVRLHLRDALPLLPGDRFVLRESGRDETVGGGEILDVAPRLPASRATPDRSVQRVIDEHGWIDADDLEATTGERRPATVGRWVVSEAQLNRGRADLLDRVTAAGADGVDLAVLDEHQRALLDTMPALRTADGRVRRADAIDELVDHPLLARLAAAGAAPAAPEGVDRGVLRQMVRRGLLWERDGIFFHPRAIELAAAAVRALAAAHPEGFTVADLRDALGISRKHAVPIAAELDSRGITRRTGDLRTPGPRLPEA